MGSDKLVSARDGGLCIFIPLNESEMRSSAPSLLLCDMNHIIDWHTESCQSNSPRRVATASGENKGRFAGSRRLWANSLFSPCSPVLFVSPLLSCAPRQLETMAAGAVVRKKWEDCSLFPITADVICVPLNCCILCRSNLQSHCVEHASWLLRDHC